LRDTEQQGDGKAEYGVRLLKHLSEDLQRKLGSGFPKRNPYRMRESCLAYSILPAPAKLNWPIIEFRGEQESVLICVNPRNLRFFFLLTLSLLPSFCLSEISEIRVQVSWLLIFSPR